MHDEDEDERLDPRMGYRARNAPSTAEDSAAGAEQRNERICVGAEEQGRDCLEGGGCEAAGEVEAQIAEAAERVLHVLAEDGKEEQVAEQMAPARA